MQVVVRFTCLVRTTGYRDRCRVINIHGSESSFQSRLGTIMVRSECCPDRRPNSTTEVSTVVPARLLEAGTCISGPSRCDQCIQDTVRSTPGRTKMVVIKP